MVILPEAALAIRNLGNRCFGDRDLLLGSELAYVIEINVQSELLMSRCVRPASSWIEALLSSSFAASTMLCFRRHPHFLK